MRFARMRASFIAGGLLAAAMIACSPSSPAPATAPVDVACPASLEAALTASCGSASETCSFLYPCGPFGATATCACDGRRFTCTDVTNAVIEDDGAAPTCVALTAAKACPLSEIGANLAACTELGQVCAYPSICKGTPAYDTCQCIPDQTGSGAVPHFDCVHSCDIFPGGDASAPGNGATPDASSDAPADGPTTDAPPSDAVPPDAHPPDAPTD
jgi:hypothetical protein